MNKVKILGGLQRLVFEFLKIGMQSLLKMVNINFFSYMPQYILSRTTADRAKIMKHPLIKLAKMSRLISKDWEKKGLLEL